MAMNTAGVADVSLEEILFNDVQDVLKQQAVLIHTITDYTSKGNAKSKQFEVPRLAGGSATDRIESGSEHSDGDMALAVDVIPFDQNKIVPQFIYDLARERTELDLDAAFMELAPASLADLIEQAIYSELQAASAAAPDHILQLNGTGNIIPILGDFFDAAKLLNDQKVPITDRYVAMGTNVHKACMNIENILDASKSLSNEALINGVFSKIAGFNLVMSTNCDADEMICYHKSALGFGMKKAVTFEKERQASKERDFLSLKTSYGRKILDSGKRVVLFNATGA